MSSSSTATQSTVHGASRWLIPASVVALFLAVLGGVMIGPAGPTWWRVPLELLNRLPLISIDSGMTSMEWAIIWQIRAPRVVLAAIVGSTLSIAGASYQGVFRNPLVDPYLLGVAAGAGLGATIVITVNRSGSSDWIIDPLPLAAFLGGLLAVLATYLVGSSVKNDRSSISLVLAGVAVTSLATAMQTFMLQRNSDVVRQVYSWILGRLSTATWGDVRLVIPYVLISSVALLMHRRLLDVLRVGDEEATALRVSCSAHCCHLSHAGYCSSRCSQRTHWFRGHHCSSRDSFGCRQLISHRVANVVALWCGVSHRCRYSWSHS